MAQFGRAGHNPNDPNSWTNYWPHGAIHYYVQGNNILHAISFNPRLQQTESYDAIANAPDLNHLLFVSCPNWGNSANPQVYDFCPHPAAIPNNGNLVGSDEYHGGPGYSQFLGFHQSFTYDGANRLQNASDSGGWSRTFNYDPYGNMWATNVNGVATGAPSSDVYNGANNQIPNTPYDAAGNLKQVNGNTLFYDAENQQVAVTEPQAYGGGTEQYWFDGSGQRVAKMGPSGTFIYVYDAAGQLVAEYASVATAAAPCSTCYLSTDHLGSPRLVTDENANVMARHDYFPFGEEVPANQVGRDTHFGSGNDTISQKFTGQMRDTETGEDFFNARMFGSGIGRFTSPDPGNAGADLYNPQSWNGYGYALGNPLRYIDPSGLNCVSLDGGGTADDGQGTPCPGSDIPSITNVNGGNSSDIALSWWQYGGPSNRLPWGSRPGSGGGGVNNGGTGGGSTSSGKGNVPTVSTTSSNATPENPCLQAGNALDPGFYAKRAADSQADPIQLVLDLNSFKRGKPLDAQPKGASPAYGNYVYGVYLRAAGLPLSVALWGANWYAGGGARDGKAQYSGTTMDVNYPNIPPVNVVNITNGYNAQKNGKACRVQCSCNIVSVI